MNNNVLTIECKIMKLITSWEIYNPFLSCLIATTAYTHDRLEDSISISRRKAYFCLFQNLLSLLEALAFLGFHRLIGYIPIQKIPCHDDGRGLQMEMLCALISGRTCNLWSADRFRS